MYVFKKSLCLCVRAMQRIINDLQLYSVYMNKQTLSKMLKQKPGTFRCLLRKIFIEIPGGNRIAFVSFSAPQNRHALLLHYTF